MSSFLGIDTGGTFTDFVWRRGHDLIIHKTPSTPDDPAAAILQGLADLGVEPRSLRIIHGTTVGTNAFLERKGAPTILITTSGFEDVLFIGRQNRSSLYDWNVTRPREIIGRDGVIGVRERMLFDGSVHKPLGGSVAARLRRICHEKGARSIAVCLLHSYANPAHEKIVKQGLAPLGLPITLSSDILPEYREYERLCATLINAYLAPVVSSYIDRLARRLGSLSLFIQQSNGGILPASSIADRAIHTILSGPAGGVHGAFHIAGELGMERIITFDMGGTSTDVSLCEGTPGLTREYAIDGYPVRIPVIDIHTVGAGGGSIAWIDAGGLLQVGPESAGADPGPACYGRGEALTVTDANLYLNRLPEQILGGRMTLDRTRVDRLMRKLAARLGMKPAETALGIVRVVNAGMMKAVRAVSVERGRDPKDFVLFAFGGASGLHCCELARELGIRTVIIPARAGILSAQGMVYSEPLLDVTQACFLKGRELHAKSLAPTLRDTERRVRGQISSLPGGEEPEIRHYLDLRYEGQSHELTVPYEKRFLDLFHEAHEKAYGYALRDRPVELVSVRCALRIPLPKIPLPWESRRERTPPRPRGEATILFGDASAARTHVFGRKEMRPGHCLQDPSLIIDDYTTILLPPLFTLEVDDLLNLVIRDQC